VTLTTMSLGGRTLFHQNVVKNVAYNTPKAGLVKESQIDSFNKFINFNAFTPKALRIFAALYSREFTRLTICGFSLHSCLTGGGAYLCGFTPWKQLSFPSSTTKK